MIENSAMLVDLNISAWTGRKMDKKVSDEIDASKGTRTRAGNYHKALLAGSGKLEEVQRIINAIRVWHYAQTLPWSDGGSRLLPMKNFFAYKAQLGAFETQFRTVVDELVAEYPQLVSAAAFQLAALFDRNEYPDVSEIAAKFRFNYVFMPVPATGDFRIDVETEALSELKTQYESFYNTKLNSAVKDVWTRLYDCLTHMSDKLSDLEVPKVKKNGDETRVQVFRDSLVLNALDLCEMLTRLNVMDDPKLEQARKELEAAIVHVTPKDIRESDNTRADVKAKVDAILQAFDF
jgi:hypothetical protein